MPIAPESSWGEPVSGLTGGVSSLLHLYSSRCTLLIKSHLRIVAILCKELDFPNSSDRVMTHCEIAFRDGYGPGSGDPETKWDLWFLPDNARNNRLCPGGCLIRGKAAYYLWDMKHKKKAA